MTILCIDGYNFLHRARGGFALGDYPVCFNFFRNLRSIVEQFKPTRVYFVIEGKPVKRLAVFPQYKANRYVETSDEQLLTLLDQDSDEYRKALKKYLEMKSFFRQKDLILQLLISCFPISVMRHSEHEADDVIYNLIKKSSSAMPWIVVSNDSDFTQLLNEFEHVKVYDPMLKSFVEKPEYDYVSWKAFRGDGSDNIPGIPGIGDKTADKLMNDFSYQAKFFTENPHALDIWHRNFDLIKFFEFDEQELSCVESSSPKRDWDELKTAFEAWQFQSLLKEKTWSKYVSTFDHLWGPNG